MQRIVSSAIALIPYLRGGLSCVAFRWYHGFPQYSECKFLKTKNENSFNSDLLYRVSYGVLRTCTEY